ncbi:hypothetical protein [Priestia megaterium]|uniref:hypothetical protein n=1 Tax=Priestia megaterium TaxID=1404 RepID=UPI0018673C8F|nr:hypothetical protein [Priestia megaterium]MBE2977821.1 hypothetical protein [Priestia megaterium]
MPKKRLSKLEEQNNEVLKQMFRHVDTVAFEANITVSDKENTLFQGIAKEVELLINQGIRFIFEEDLKAAYQKLELHTLYYLREATITIKSIRVELNPGFTIHNELKIDLLDSDITIYIKPTYNFE